MDMEFSSAEFADILSCTKALRIPRLFRATTQVHGSGYGPSAVSTGWFKHPDAKDKDKTDWCVEVRGRQANQHCYGYGYGHGYDYEPTSFDVMFKIRRISGDVGLLTVVARLEQVGSKSTQVNMLSYDMGPKCSVNPDMLYDIGEPVDRLPEFQEGTVTVWITYLRSASLKRDLTIPQYELRDRTQKGSISLWEKRKYTDVVLAFNNGQKLEAHKAVLMCASPVFEAMFGHDFKEKDENEVLISDISYEAMHEAMRFIYTGNSDLSSVALVVELIDVSEKYELTELKAFCESALADFIKESEDGSLPLELLPVADQYCLLGLKACCERSILTGKTMKPDIDLLKVAIKSNSKILKKVALTRLASGLSENLKELKEFDSSLFYEVLQFKASITIFSGVD